MLWMRAICCAAALFLFMVTMEAWKGEIMKMRDEYTCPLELTHDMIKGKWKPIILWQLSKGPQSLSSLKK